MNQIFQKLGSTECAYNWNEQLSKMIMMTFVFCAYTRSCKPVQGTYFSQLMHRSTLLWF